MKTSIVFLLCILLLPFDVLAADWLDTSPVEGALDIDTRKNLGDMTAENGDIASGINTLSKKAVKLFRDSLRKASAAAFSMAALCAIAGLAVSFSHASGLNTANRVVEMTSVCGLTVLALSPLGSLFETCRKAIEGLNLFGKALIPAFAAATAVAGRPVSGASSAAAAILFGNILTDLALKVFLPCICLYVGANAAGLIAQQDILSRIAGLLKWGCVSFYKTFLMIFLAYTTLAGVVSGGADAAAVKTARLAISTGPVLGPVVADASDAILTGAGVLRTAIGAYGFLGACAICLVPFVSALTQYMTFKILGVVSASFAAGSISKMIDAIAGGYGIALGLLGTCCAVNFISMIAGTVVIRV